MKRALKRLAYSPLPPILLAASLVLSEYQKNLSMVYPGELWVPLAAAAIIGALPFYFFRWLMPRSLHLAHLLAALLIVPVLYDYDTQLHNLGTWLSYIRFYPYDWLLNCLFVGLLFGLVGLVGLLSERFLWKTKLRPLQAAQFLIIMTTVAFLSGAFGTAQKMVKLWPQLSPVTQPNIPTPSAPPASKPDIYYLVLEDYANNDILKDIYHYDNSPFLDSLTAQGFVVNNSAYSNYPYTSDSLPSTLQMDYLTNVSAKFKSATTTDLPMRAIFDNPPIASQLKKQGYQYLNVGSWWTDTRNIPSADTNYTQLFNVHIFGFSASLSEFAIDILDHSFFGRLLGVNNSDAAQIVKYQLENLHQIAQAPSQGSRFIFGHIIMPHAPYVFDANGNLPTYGPWEDAVGGVSPEQKYINQMRYINGQVESLIKDIKAHSKQAVIILQSDEGPHPSEMAHNDDELANFDLNTLTDQKLRQKYGILAAYDLPGATPDEVAQITSPVNAFRVVLNQYLGYNLPILPDCSYAMKTRNKVYDFVDVTARLHGGTEDPRCPTIHQ